MQSFREALKHVAKSGEVWCEGARIYLNPVSKHFHLLNASKCLNYAVFFTPQYGDSFIEVGGFKGVSFIGYSSSSIIIRYFLRMFSYFFSFLCINDLTINSCYCFHDETLFFLWTKLGSFMVPLSRISLIIS